MGSRMNDDDGLNVAGTICWLVSTAASFVTGSIVVVGGGYLIKN